MMNHPEYKSRLKELGCIVVIPTYNNVGTICQVVDSVRCYSDDIMVVNDGSTDGTEKLLEQMEDIVLVSYPKNKGKGFALKKAIREAWKLGYKYALTIDADGQHYADDIPVFIDEIEKNPGSLLVGARNLTADNMPSKNTFANKFSNFWFKVETGQTMSDTQSGYRLYPLDKVAPTRFITRRYEFEVEVLVRAAWKGVSVRNVPIKVYYAPEGERVSHFRPFRDFTRISILNTLLVTIAVLWYYPYKMLKKLSPANIAKFFNTYLRFSEQSNSLLAASIAWGMFCGVIPCWGYQMVVSMVSSRILRLNVVVSSVMTNFSIPPLIPFILYGSMYIGSIVTGTPFNFDVTTISLQTVHHHLLQYVIGSFILAAAVGLVAYVISYMLLVIFKGKGSPKKEHV